MQNQCLAKNLDSEDSDKVDGLDWLKGYGGLVNTLLFRREQQSDRRVMLDSRAGK